MYESRPRALAEFDLDVDARIREIAETLHRMSRRLSMRLTKDGDFLESVAHVLECEHQLVNSLRCALDHYDRLLESVFEKVDGIVKPPPHVIDVDYEPEPVTAASVEP